MNHYRLYDESECGKDGYPVVWHTIKHEVREAAGHRCVRCLHPYRNGTHGRGEWTPCDGQCRHLGEIRVVALDGGGFFTTHQIAASSDWRFITDLVAAGRVEAPWRILTVHHLDGNKRNLRWWNLVALCQRCHLEIQGRVRVDQIYPWPHSEWFKPYAAGLYAWMYLEQDLTREEVEARLPELLALECVA